MREQSLRETERWLRQYKFWQARMQSLKVQINELPKMTQQLEFVSYRSPGQISDSTYEIVARRLKSQYELAKLEMRIRLLEIALETLIDEERELVELKYFRDLPNQFVWEGLAMSRRAFYRKQSEVIMKLTKAMAIDFIVVDNKYRMAE